MGLENLKALFTSNINTDHQPQPVAEAIDQTPPALDYTLQGCCDSLLAQRVPDMTNDFVTSFAGRKILADFVADKPQINQATIIRFLVVSAKLAQMTSQLGLDAVDFIHPHTQSKKAQEYEALKTEFLTLSRDVQSMLTQNDEARNLAVNLNKIRDDLTLESIGLSSLTIAPMPAPSMFATPEDIEKTQNALARSNEFAVATLIRGLKDQVYNGMSPESKAQIISTVNTVAQFVQNNEYLRSSAIVMLQLALAFKALRVLEPTNDDFETKTSIYLNCAIQAGSHVAHLEMAAFLNQPQPPEHVISPERKVLVLKHLSAYTNALADEITTAVAPATLPVLNEVSAMLSCLDRDTLKAIFTACKTGELVLNDYLRQNYFNIDMPAASIFPLNPTMPDYESKLYTLAIHFNGSAKSLVEDLINQPVRHAGSVTLQMTDYGAIQKFILSDFDLSCEDTIIALLKSSTMIGDYLYSTTDQQLYTYVKGLVNLKDHKTQASEGLLKIRTYLDGSSRSKPYKYLINLLMVEHVFKIGLENLTQLSSIWSDDQNRSFVHALIDANSTLIVKARELLTEFSVTENFKTDSEQADFRRLSKIVGEFGLTYHQPRDQAFMTNFLENLNS